MARYMENVEILLTRTDGTVLDLAESGFRRQRQLRGGRRHRLLHGPWSFPRSSPWRRWPASAVGGVAFPIPGGVDRF